MTEANVSATEPVPRPDPATSTPGEYLRKLREEKGQTHAAVGTALHLTVHYIKALESDDYGKLPGLTFVKGYLRAYARFLGADVDGVLSRFDGHIAGLLDAGKHTARVERSKRRQDQAVRWGIGAGFVVVSGLLVGWWFMSGEPEPAEPTARATPALQGAALTTPPSPRAGTQLAGTVTPPAANAASTTITQQTAIVAADPATPLNPPQAADSETVTGAAPAAVAAAEPGAPATPEAVNTDAAAPAAATVTAAANGARQVSLVGAGDDELRVTFNGSSWIEVEDGGMVRIFQDMLAAGDTLTIRGEAPFHVLLGDAANVEVSMNAAAVDVSASIRADSTARLVLGTPAGGAQGEPEGAREVPL